MVYTPIYLVQLLIPVLWESYREYHYSCFISQDFPKLDNLSIDFNLSLLSDMKEFCFAKTILIYFLISFLSRLIFKQFMNKSPLFVFFFFSLIEGYFSKKVLSASIE